MDVSAVAKQSRISIPIARALIDGVTKADLHALLSVELGLPLDSPQLDLARMNCVGAVRGSGFLCTGGRLGRGQPYQIVGLAPQKDELPPASQWTGLARETLDWVHSFRLMTADDLPFVRLRLSTRTDHQHENAGLYLWAYELARDHGRLVSVGDETAVVIKKFETQPRLRIFNLNMSKNNLIALARQIGPASVRPVAIIGVDPKDFKGCVKRPQAVYRTREIVENPRQFWSNSSWRRVKHRLDDTQLYVGCPPPHLMKQVVDEWKRVNASKHRQLAIGRDYVSIDTHCPGRITMLGMRDNQTVSVRVMEVHPNDRSYASELTGKDLNVAEQVGGKTGTSDWTIYQQSKALVEIGVDYLNVGADSGEMFLWQHKLRFAKENIVSSYTFTTEFRKSDS